MAQSLLVDTDVLIDYLRGVGQAVSFLERVRGPLLVSAISVAELYSGVREGAERKAMESFLTAFELVVVDGIVAARGGLYRRKYGGSHGVGLADALIAATAETRRARLATLNRRHFPMFDGVVVPYRRK